MSFKKLKSILANTSVPVVGTESLSSSEEVSPTPPAVSTEIDEDGHPTPNTIDDNNYYAPLLDTSGMEACEVGRITAHVGDTQKAIPYCPVYVSVDMSTENLHATAYITGQIRDMPDYVDLIDVLELMTSEDTITLYIDSPGGYVVTGAAVASAVDNCKGKTIGVARGLCASAGSLIWSSCDVCLADPFSTFMYHMSTHLDMGNSEMIRERAALQVKYVQDCLLAVAKEKGHITDDEFDMIVNGKKDIYIPAAQMLSRLRTKVEESTITEVPHED